MKTHRPTNEIDRINQSPGPYGLEQVEAGLLVIDGRNERPVALRRSLDTAAAICRQLNGEKPQQGDTTLMARALGDDEFGPDTKETTCFTR